MIYINDLYNKFPAVQCDEYRIYYLFTQRHKRIWLQNKMNRTIEANEH